ncbi:amino acid adenylation domain-containing protein [Anopheles sinensis]|uniref:Amino acid adenylation domain-containing protein n=1 Tax=Anopheles sinensis TaxID=74873 RepID=A0A084W6R6_ANOSI|nr:amino acid adenylation domain-containing protein [Anopheles sinensis]
MSVATGECLRSERDSESDALRASERKRWCGSSQAVADGMKVEKKHTKPAREVYERSGGAVDGRCVCVCVEEEADASSSSAAKPLAKRGFFLETVGTDRHHHRHRFVAIVADAFFALMLLLLLLFLLVFLLLLVVLVVPQRW